MKLTLSSILEEAAKNGNKSKKASTKKVKINRDQETYDDNQEIVVDKNRYDRVKKSYETMHKLAQITGGLVSNEDVEDLAGPVDGSEWLGDFSGKKKNKGVLGYGPWIENDSSKNKGLNDLYSKYPTKKSKKKNK